MAIRTATNFENNSNDPLDAYSVFESMAYLLASEWRKEGVLIYLKDVKEFVFWNGSQYIKHEAGMPNAPFGKVYGATGQSWHELTNVDQKYAYINEQEIAFTAADDVLTLDPAELLDKDNFTIIHNGATVVFYKNHPAVNTLTAIGVDMKLYQFAMDWTAGTVTITELLDLTTGVGGASANLQGITQQVGDLETISNG